MYNVRDILGDLSLNANEIVEYVIKDDPHMLGDIIAGFMIFNGGDQLKMTVTCRDHETQKVIGKTEIDIKHVDM